MPPKTLKDLDAPDPSSLRVNGIPNGNGNANGLGPARPPSSASKVKPRPSSIGAPTITPRLNKSAALRAAKQEAEQAAAAKAAAAKKGGARPPPSSFKAVVV